MRLFGDGKHGQAERIQTFRCQACRTTFTSRRNTPLYCLKTPSQQIAMVLSVLAEGLDASAAERVAGLSSGHYHYLAKPCWRARTDLARALLWPSLDPPPPTSLPDTFGLEEQKGDNRKKKRPSKKEE